MIQCRDDIGDEEELQVVYYHTPLYVIHDRLELLGYTLEASKEAFTKSHREKVTQLKELSTQISMSLLETTVQILDTSDVDEWLAALREIQQKDLKQRRIGEPSSSYEGTLIGHMLGNDWYGYHGPDPNIFLRLALEVCPESDEFIYDVTDLVIGGYVSVDEDLAEYALDLSRSAYSSSGKTIVLTEGRSDSWIIFESLQLLYPHLSDYFSFMDFEGAKVGGGAGNLANIVKAFAGAGIVNKVVALFDNDTAADAAIYGLRSVRIPKNIQIQKLPDLPALRLYPTIGPSGLIMMDVNGMAASIELYVGSDLIMEDIDDLIPVQWTGYNSVLQKYQGEVLFKDRIQKRFRQRLEACKADKRLLENTDWSGLRSVLSNLFTAFQEIDGMEIQAFFNEYYAH